MNTPDKHAGRPLFASTPLFASSWVALFMALRAHLLTGEIQHLRPSARRGAGSSTIPPRSH